MVLSVHAAESVVGSYPKVSLLVFLYARDAVVCQSALNAVMVCLVGFQVIAEQTVVGADAQLPSKLSCDARGNTIVRCVLTIKGREPVFFLDVHGADTHRCGDIYPFFVG